jgi:hypothetical protein
MPDYTSIFEVLGQYARAFTQIDNLASRNLSFSSGGETFRSLDKLREEFVAVLNDSVSERDRLDAVAILSDAARVARGWGSGLEQSLNTWVREALARELDAEGASRDELLRALQRAMLADNESVAANDVSAGAVTQGANNAGDAACYASAQTVDAAENVVDDERVRNQRVAIECTRDHPNHRAPLGREEFRVRPEVGPPVSTRVIPVTYGEITDPRNVIIDGAFEADALAHWQAQAGGGVFSRDDSLQRFGEASLKITGDGSTAGDLRQDLAERDPPMPSGRFWALGAWVYVASHTAGSVTVDLLVDGQASGLSLVVDGSTPTTEWLHLGGFEYLPRGSFPNKVQVRIRCSADFDGVVHLDGVCLAAATGAVAPHAVPVADRFTVDCTSDDAGGFQTFARDRLGIALPSSGTPTVSDALSE